MDGMRAYLHSAFEEILKAMQVLDDASRAAKANRRDRT
jgi:hypothetical protein